MELPPLSRRSQQVLASPIRKLLPMAQAAEQRGLRVWRLNVGDPDFEPPAVFYSKLRQLAAGRLNYAPSPGLPEHVAAWQAYYLGLKVRLSPEQILPTQGCAEAISLALLAVADPGDEILVFEPVYTSYKAFAAMAGIKLVPITLSAENGFALPKAAVLAGKVTKRTRALVLVNPDNPTGKLWPRREMAALLELAQRHNLFVLADETYREVRFDGALPFSLLSMKASGERVVVCDSLSKRFSLPGARLGCLASRNGDFMAAALRFAQARLSTGTLEQRASVPLLLDAKPYVSKIVSQYRSRARVAVAALAKIPGAEFFPAGGAFYQTVRLPVADSEDFAKFLINDFSCRGATVLVTPLKDFYVSAGFGLNEIRLALVLPPRELRQAVAVLAEGLKAYLQSVKK